MNHHRGKEVSWARGGNRLRLCFVFVTLFVVIFLNHVTTAFSFKTRHLNFLLSFLFFISFLVRLECVIEAWNLSNCVASHRLPLSVLTSGWTLWMEGIHRNVSGCKELQIHTHTRSPIVVMTSLTSLTSLSCCCGSRETQPDGFCCQLDERECSKVSLWAQAAADQTFSVPTACWKLLLLFWLFILFIFHSEGPTDDTLLVSCQY